MPSSSPTYKFAVVGTPITHSLSPAMHNAAFKACGTSAVMFPYDPQSPQGYSAWCRSVRAAQAPADVCGFCTTVPYKIRALQECATVDGRARAIGAVNTVTRSPQGDLRGNNTDASGFGQALSSGLDETLGISLSGATAVLFGTGGVARAMLYELLAREVGQVVVVSRRMENAQALIAELSPSHAGDTVCRAATDIGDEVADVLINATPLGLKPEDPSIVDAETIATHGRYVFDAVYRPVGTTRLVSAARAVGVPAQDGRLMLVEQGVIASSLWNEQYGIWGDRGTRDLVRSAMMAVVR